MINSWSKEDLANFDKSEVFKELEKRVIDTVKRAEILQNKIIDYNDVTNRLQKINNELSINFRSYGTKNIESLLTIVFGNDYVEKNINRSNKDLYTVIRKFVHPISYKIMEWKE